MMDSVALRAAPDAFSAQRRHCAPTYAVVELPLVGDTGDAGAVRIPDAPREPAADDAARIRRGLVGGVLAHYPPRRIALAPALEAGPRARWAQL